MDDSDSEETSVTMDVLSNPRKERTASLLTPLRFLKYLIIDENIAFLLSRCMRFLLNHHKPNTMIKTKETAKPIIPTSSSPDGSLKMSRILRNN